MKPQWIDIDGASFELKALSALGKMSLIEHGNAHKGKSLVFDSKVCDEALRECLVGWRDLQDEDGSPIRFTIDKALAMLPHTVISGLMLHIFNTAFLSELDEKKS